MQPPARQSFGDFLRERPVSPVLTWGVFWLISFVGLWRKTGASEVIATRAVIEAAIAVGTLWVAQRLILWLAWHYYGRRRGSDNES